MTMPETSTMPGSCAAHDEPTEGEPAQDFCHPAKLFVGGLPRETSTQQLRDHFSKHGRIVDCVVMRWSDGRSRGFGYITYDNNDSATEALNTAQSLGGRLVDVKRAVPGTNKLFAGGLAQGVTAAELRSYFTSFGPVSDAVVMMDSATGRSRGFGFVCFAPGPEGATAIAAALANYENNHLRGKWIEVKSAAPPQELSKAADASYEAAMPPPPQSPALVLNSHMGMTGPMAALQQYHAAHAAAAAHAQCMVQGLVAASLPHHMMLPHPHMMSANAPEFMPDAELVRPRYDSNEQAMMWPGGRPPATPQSDRAHTLMPGATATAAAAAQMTTAALEKKLSTSGRAPVTSIPSTGVVNRPPPGLSLPDPDIEGRVSKKSPELPAMNPELPVYIEVPDAVDVKEMSCQTEGPGCLACGAAFGCGGRCTWAKHELLGLRRMVQKDDQQRTSLHAKRVGGRSKASTGGA
eukprot:gnl/MRDRNA2_/MRDRNA2_88741_c0_seq1.p1 gnl/MRDRNA2_/MRDRNA2_88741_c0~~gnl/MRDRNA2_/MRDRNA2_88741_c0_seq1.p1  ORF type:complete len:464 (+),score=104.08 gnl/MRDRNA2_/MRDRNA2_88741_c0_seq1:106-1497(+)